MHNGATIRNHCIFFPTLSQVPVAVVTPGGQPVSAMGRSVASYSGHILKLVPGDFQWSLPQFPIVIVWNGSDTFTPTQFVKANAVTDWKMGVIGRHLGEAIKLFEEVEEDVVHSHKPALLKSFRNLRNSTIVTDMLLGDTVVGHSQNIPPVSYGPKKGTSTHLTYHVDPHYIPQAEFRHDVNLDVLNVPGMPAKSAETPEAPIRGTFAFFPDPNAEFPVQDFSVPVEIFLSVLPGARNFPPKPETPAAPAPVAPPVPTQRHLELFKTISSRQTGKAAPSIAVTIPMPPPNSQTFFQNHYCCSCCYNTNNNFYSQFNFNYKFYIFSAQHFYIFLYLCQEVQLQVLQIQH